MPKVVSVWPSKTSHSEAVPSRRTSPKVLSLTGQEDFGRLLSQRPAGSQGPFSIHLNVSPAPPEAVIRLGFILPKKMMKRAVWRNQVKRWSRELLRHELGRLAPDRLALVSVDILVRVRAKLGILSGPAGDEARNLLVVTFSQAFERRFSSPPISVLGADAV